MLELINIHKNYSAGENQVRALRGIDLQFRKNEFVSILGPSGCGKTTMLNIIGGLDQYSQGDLIIDGVSTKNYGDRDWDTYRNHSIGFVFQSYNLIPHQSVLANVEMALTLSGVGRRERRERAKKVLEQVGLGDQLRKKPSEMSGGQMQRVAIARALVNNPDIILADEPTGALDTETSVQVMELLKGIAKDRLVIMVTHNPELAETYSTRIIRMLDGKITGDTMPFTEDERLELMLNRKTGKQKKVRKPSMSLGTSFSLSLKNLITKKGRTVLTSFAGSIGIIGIALIYAVSQGATAYINTVQEETLASYPLTLQATTVDMSTLMQTFMGQAREEEISHELDGVYSQSVMFEMINALNNIESTENDLTTFKAKVEQELKDPESMLYKTMSGVQYTYDLDLLVYTKSVDGNIIYSDTQSMMMDAMAKNFGTDMSNMLSMQDQMSESMGMPMASAGMNLWTEMLSGKDGSLISPLITSQYDLVTGQWPSSYDEVVLVVDANYELDDLTLYALGLKSQEEIDQVFEAVANGGEIDTTQQKWTFEEIMDMEFKVILNSDCYVFDEAAGIYTDLRDTDAGMRYLYDEATRLKVVGIIAPDPDATSTMLTGSIAYTRELTEYVVEKSDASDAISYQLENEKTDIFTGLPFKDEGSMTDSEKETAFREYLQELTESEKAQVYVEIMSIPSQEQLDAAVENALSSTDRAAIEQILIQATGQQMSVDISEVERYIGGMTDEELNTLYSEMVIMQVQAQTAAAVQQQLAEVPEAQLVLMLDEQAKQFTVQQCARYYDEIIEFSESTLEDNLKTLGYVDLDAPATMNLYASSFANKEIIEDFIAEYNDTVEDLKQIRYTDYVGLMMSGITTIINAITYILIAFVAISLVVSSIMIGVITLISVQERTKEIGILRAIGASKKNVSSMFNAETVIIGFTSGVLGVAMTWLLCIPVNAIVQTLTGISSLKAVLPWKTAAVLVGISVVLTLVAGIIPSRSAAKKDPVVALRTE